MSREGSCNECQTATANYFDIRFGNAAPGVIGLNNAQRISMQDDYETIMQWVMLLPDVNDQVLQARETVVAHLQEAVQLERQAKLSRISADHVAKAQLERQAKIERTAADHAAHVLESMVRRAGWTEDEIATAKARANA